jgi:hypothetical protein
MSQGDANRKPARRGDLEHDRATVRWEGSKVETSPYYKGSRHLIVTPVNR